MNKVVYFNNNQTADNSNGQKYYNFIDYAFSVTDYFMLVYVNYYGKGYSKIMRDYLKSLKKFEIKKRTNPHWPGTTFTEANNTTYKIVFYQNNVEAREILKTVSNVGCWSRPKYPQDLAFFKGNQCWFYSVGHENICSIIRATEDDIEFLNKNSIEYYESKAKWDHQYSNYDENII